MSMNTKLSSEAVRAIAMDCLYEDGEAKSGEIPPGAVVVEGLRCHFSFHPDRIAKAKPAVDALLRELPDQFRKDVGGGWSFLNGCMTRDDRQWGEQFDVDVLVCLGIGVGSASWVMKDTAAILPGGVPYFEIHPGEDQPQ